MSSEPMSVSDAKQLVLDVFAQAQRDASKLRPEAIEMALGEFEWAIRAAREPVRPTGLAGIVAGLKEAEEWDKPAAVPAHLSHVQRFLTEMYQVMVDPVEKFEGNIEQLCALLIERAKQDRETIHAAREPVPASSDAQERHKDNCAIWTRMRCTCGASASSEAQTDERKT